MSKQFTDNTEQYKKFYEAWEKTMTDAMDIWKSNPLFKGELQQGADNAANYKKFYETWEKSSSEIMEQWVSSPLFAANVGKAVEKSSELKIYFDEAVERTLKSMQFPSKNDVDRLHASINNLEEKINDLTDMIENLSTPKKTGRK